jgi:aryl-alcohol dehydrogenase
VVDDVLSRAITAAVAEGADKPFRLTTLDLDEPAAGEILVRLVAVGLCHTDLAARDGDMPIEAPVVLGHEGAGVVEAVGSNVTKVRVGDHVVMTFDSCGVCPTCEKGFPAYCHQFAPMNFACRRADGTTGLRDDSKPIFRGFFGQSSFASFAISHERNTVTVPSHLPLAKLAPLACGVQTGAGAVINSLSVSRGSSIAVLGTGTVGLSALLAAVAVGCEGIVAVDVLESRLAMATSLGATGTVLAKSGRNLTEALRALRPAGFDFIIDTTARPDTISQAILSLAPHGSLALIGVPRPGHDELHASMLAVMAQGLTIRGVVEGDSVPDTFIPYLAGLYADGRFPFDRLISEYDFSDINQAVADQAAGLVVKPVLLF